ncbi:MAG: carotenoid biosynthesis protein [Beijerinckiaceae bacterium]
MQFLARHLADQITIYHGKLIIWVVLLFYSAGVVAAAGTPSSLAQFLALLGILIAFAHAVLAYGRSLAFAFLGLCLLVTFSMENLGIATGFPFGRYHFEVASNLPHIGAVPIIVGPLYFAMGYFSWIIASILLGQADLKLDRVFYRLALPIVAAFVMVQWDVVMDPPNATLGHAWVWHDGGGYFGVPLSNFLGWYLTVWLFYQAFALVLGRFGPHPAQSREFWLIPILLYFSVALSLAVPYFTETTREMVDIAGTKWNAHDLHETAAIIAVFTMVFTSVLSLIRLVEETPSRHSQ